MPRTPQKIRKISIGTVLNGRYVLLGKKPARASLVQYGKYECWQMFGGKIERDETPYLAFIREMGEEVNLCVSAAELVATVLYKKIIRGKIFKKRLYIYLSRSFTGIPRSTPEIEAWQWSRISELPFDKMLDEDKILLPRILAGEKLVACVTIRMEGTQRKLECLCVRPVKSFPPRHNR